MAGYRLTVTFTYLLFHYCYFANVGIGMAVKVGFMSHVSTDFSGELVELFNPFHLA
jgi:hypothetical protein